MTKLIWDAWQLTHFRNLADAIALKPEKTHNFIKTLSSVAFSDRMLVLHVSMLKNRLPDQPVHEDVWRVANEFIRDDSPLTRRLGETLVWGLRNRGYRDNKT